MVRRIAAYVKENGQQVGKAERSATYTAKGEMELTVTYFGEQITALSIGGANDFTIDGEDVVCIDGNPKMLIEAYDYIQK
jgi:hypothetical protein